MHMYGSYFLLPVHAYITYYTRGCFLIVTSERDNQNCRVSVSRRIYNTENSTDQLETGVSKHFFRL